MYSVWGTGTQLYGHDDFNPDDRTYLATMWLTIFWLPILPLGSYIVSDIQEEKVKLEVFPPGVSRSSEHTMVEVSLNWRQVLKAYRWALPVGIAVALFLYFAGVFD